jgi:hypothetical protein
LMRSIGDTVVAAAAGSSAHASVLSK